MTLINLAIKPQTLAAYRKALDKFQDWATARGEKITRNEADSLMYDWFSEEYQADGSRSTCATAFSALLHFNPALKGNMPLCARALKGWEKAAPSESAEPMSWTHACALAGALVKLGHLGAAVGLLVGYDCYLRISEMCDITLDDVVLPERMRELGVQGDKMLIHIGQSKTGTNQGVPVRSKPIADLLRWYISEVNAKRVGLGPSILKPGRSGKSTKCLRLFGLSTTTFSNLLKKASIVVGLESIEYTAHSLRHGGATTDYLNGVSLDEIMKRGRWRSRKSLDVYVRAGRAAFVGLINPDAARVVGETVAKDPCAVIQRYVRMWSS